MAKTIQVRQVPDRVHRALKTRAAAAGVSLSDYVLEELIRVTERPAIADVLRRAGDRPRGIEAASLVSVVREGRDRA